MGSMNNPIFLDVDPADSSSIERLAAIAKSWMDNHPGCPGFHCVVPKLGGPIMITEARFY